MKRNLISNLAFSYHIRRSSKARQTRIVVTPGKVEVVAPVKVSEHNIEQFVRLKQQWIIDALARLHVKSQRHNSLAPAVYEQGAEVPYQGTTYKLAITPTHLKKIKIEFYCEFMVHVPEIISKQEHSAAIKEALIRWMKKESRLQVERLVKQHAGKKQLFPQSIKIKTQKSRWGSCGINNDININWLLMMAPPEILEYVVVHELCHIQIRNHSAHFWALVAEHLPDYQSRRQWLKKHGGSLMLGL